MFEGKSPLAWLLAILVVCFLIVAGYYTFIDDGEMASEPAVEESDESVTDSDDSNSQ